MTEEKKDFKTLQCSNFCLLLPTTSFCFKAGSKKQNQTPATGLSTPAQPAARPLQPAQPNAAQQTGVPTSGPSQNAIHVLPTGTFILHPCVNAPAANFS